MSARITTRVSRPPGPASKRSARTTGFFAWAALFCGACGPADVPEQPDGARPPTRSDPSASGDSREAILILGDSLTAGYGVARAEAWPSLLQRRLDEAGLAYRVLNAGISGDTTSGGLGRLDWYASQPVAVVVLALGGNDGLRGIPPEHVRENLRSLIDRSRELWPDANVVIAGMQAPPSMGEAYASAFREVFPQLARETGAHLVPFLLEGVGGEEAMNQADGIHPNAAGHARVEENVAEVLLPILERRAARGEAAGRKP